MPIDFRGSEDASPSLWTFVHPALPPRRLPLTQIVHLERDLPRDAANGQVAAHQILSRAEQLNLIPTESDLRMLLHVQEVGAAKVGVAIRLAAPKIARVNLDRDSRVLGMLGIESERAPYILEVPADAGDHHVASAKLCRGVPRLECPFHDWMLYHSRKKYFFLWLFFGWLC